MVFVQIWPFFQLFFLGNILQENVFNDLLERKNAFLGYKNKKFKKSKNWHFSKGVTHRFGPKLGIFPTFFISNKGQENVFDDILERKNAFVGYKNNKLKKSKNWQFPMVLVQKWPFFHLFIFRQYRSGKCLLLYSRPKKRLFSL